ncbi:MarR family winged helix-turn-helix transcriptional regulator [Companilactobacillus mishanensis]|uniref:MarR family winged helix-turn-helix transcriptional regulator n=1 Tax=Companilactobacillus mishanensis TaxID=2486008 RepID=UPI0012975D98|nr:MarR family transcriptional regulator [Companilactobacillus mishanensis]MQS88908.1 MarR family transcriptional regulator [Companilactobacillus mishanensis]
MPNITKQKNAASKLIEFNMVRHIAEDATRLGHSDYDDNQPLFKGQGKILLALSQEDGLSQKELADRLNLTAQSTAEFVGKLVKKGFVTKEKSQHDKRVVIIKLTDSGRENSQTATAEIPDYIKALTDEELDQLSALFTKINANLYEQIKATNPTWFSKFHKTVTDTVRDWFL